MNLIETRDLLNRLIASDSKVQICMILNGNTVELAQDRHPMTAADALVAVEAAHATATDCGMVPTFNIKRWEA